MQHYQNNVTDLQGNAIVGVGITVKTLAGVNATLYSDNGVTPIGNPVTTDSSGVFQFYAANGTYTLTLSNAGGVTTTTLSPITLFDPSDREVCVSDAPFSAKGDGVTDDRLAFVNAMAALGSLGGTVRYFKKHLIDSSMTVPKNITIKGPMSMVGSPGTNNSAPYGGMAALIVNSLATITLASGAGVDGVLAYRKGMTFPTADAAAFAGTCFTGGGDDFFVLNSMALGFNKAVYSTGFQRPRIQNFNFDCNNGIEIVSCADISHIRNCHAWPFATIESYAVSPVSANWPKLRRSGTAYLFSTIGDWNKVSDCFAYGYFRGFYMASVSSMTLLGCSADSTTGYVGQIGFLADGTSLDTRLIACQAAAQDTGFQIATPADKKTRMIGCDSWACATAAVVIQSGDLTIIGGHLRDTVDAIRITNAASKVTVDDVNFSGLTGLPFSLSVANPNLQIGMNDYGNLPVSTSVATVANKTGTSVAAADPLPVPPNASVLTVTGVTNFGNINGGYLGRELTLIFTGTPTITSSTGSNTAIRLNGKANYTAAAGDCIQLVHNGDYWHEVAAPDNAGWATYTPTVTAGTGLFTTLGTVVGRYKDIGKTRLISIVIPITTNGTAASTVVASIPNGTAASEQTISGRENASGGKQLQGIIASGGTTFSITNFDNTYPGGSGFRLIITGAIEMA